MFSACPTEMLLTLQLKTGSLPVLTGSVQISLVMFRTGWFVCRACPELVFRYLTITGWEVLANKMVTRREV